MSDDPTLTDDMTLLASVRRDFAGCRAKMVDAWRLLDAATVALWELESRAAKRAEAAEDQDPPP